MPPTAKTPTAPRDTTRALDLALVLVGAIHALVPDQSSRLHTTGYNLISVLRDMDARTGRRDPSVRKAARRPAKAAKRVTRG